MNRLKWIPLVVLVVAFAWPAVAADRREGEARGTFVRLVEKKVGEQEYVGIVVKDLEGDKTATLLILRRNADQMAAARALKAGQKVEVAYVTEEGHHFVRRIEAEGLAAGVRAGKAKRLLEQVRELQARVKRLEAELKALRAQNKRLKQELVKRGGADAVSKAVAKGVGKGDKPAASKEGGGTVPASLRGFRGMVTGTIVSKAEKGFVLKVEKVNRVWKGSKAKDPKSAVGKQVHITISPKYDRKGKHTRALAKLKVGDRVVVEPFHFGGEFMVVVEELRKAE